MTNIEKTWIELKTDSLTFENLEQFIEEQKVILKKSANLNSLKWYGSKIGKREKYYFDSVNIVTNYVEKSFDTLTNLITTFDFGLIY